MPLAKPNMNQRSYTGWVRDPPRPVHRWREFTSAKQRGSDRRWYAQNRPTLYERENEAA